MKVTNNKFKEDYWLKYTGIADKNMAASRGSLKEHINEPG